MGVFKRIAIIVTHVASPRLHDESGSAERSAHPLSSCVAHTIDVPGRRLPPLAAARQG